MPNWGLHRSPADQRTGLGAAMRRMFGRQDETARAEEDTGALSGRVSQISAQMGPRLETYCSACGYGIMRPLAATETENTAGQPLEASLQCDRCDHIMHL